MLALDLAVLTGLFVLMGLIFQDKPTRMLMRYAGILGIIIVLFQLQVTYGFTAALGALFLMFILIFLFMLILDVVMLIPILLNSMKKRGWIR
jgi:hypothetical protein